MSQQTITEFLEARIAEDEDVAKAASTGPWFRDSGWSISAPAPEGWDGPYVVVETPRARNDSEFVARHDPDRVLAECAAKRAILGDYLREYRMRADMDRHNTNPAIYYGLPSDKVLRQITSVYADHPDYQQEWA